MSFAAQMGWGRLPGLVLRRTQSLEVATEGVVTDQWYLKGVAQWK